MEEHKHCLSARMALRRFPSFKRSLATRQDNLLSMVRTLRRIEQFPDEGNPQAYRAIFEQYRVLSGMIDQMGQLLSERERQLKEKTTPRETEEERGKARE